MQKKSVNKVLAIVLFFSLIILAGLVSVLWLKNQKEVTGNQKEQSDTNNSSTNLLVVTPKRYSTSYGSDFLPDAFIHHVESVHEVTYSYVKAPDVTKYGSQKVIIRVTDALGNYVDVESKLNIINLKDELKVNIGSSFPVPEDFLVEQGSDIFYGEDVNYIDLSVPQKYSIVFRVDGTYARAVLSVDDYAAPEVKTREVEAWLNHPVDAKDFVESVTDYSTEIEYAYQLEPDWSVAGNQQVEISATDKNGNTSIWVTNVVLHEDNVPPVVSAGNADVTIGSAFSYKKMVNYFDNASPMEELTLQVDNSQVNLSRTGSYDVTYTVTDFAGNSTSVVAKVNVVEEEPLWNKEELLAEKGVSVLESILQEDMSDYQKADAIYKWVQNNIRFINFSEKDNYARGAYEGLYLQKGDCFVYAATSKYLLTLAGVNNVDIKKSSTNPSHYWNLVYIEDGWYHFDACPNKAGVKIFLFNDAELEKFSVSQGNSHIYDKSLYPEIK